MNEALDKLLDQLGFLVSDDEDSAYRVWGARDALRETDDTEFAQGERGEAQRAAWREGHALGQKFREALSS